MVKSSCRLLRMLGVLAATGVMLNAAFAHAQEQQSSSTIQKELKAETYSHIYTAPYCDFQLGFPEEPEISTNDVPASSGEMVKEDHLSFSKVFSPTNSIYMEANCRSLVPGERNMLNDAAIRNTIAAYIKDNDIVSTGEKIFTDEETGARAGILLGSKRGMEGQSFVTYQLWLTQNSLLLFEIQNNGPMLDDANAMFTNILRNINLKTDDQ
ncbi:MAG: hypothetical protein AB7E85_00315 [Pseudobdellovibrionaceae bacterium]